jgi:hypothetical protein
VGRAYRKLVRQWRRILPTESFSLHTLPPEDSFDDQEPTLTWGGNE